MLMRALFRLVPVLLAVAAPFGAAQAEPKIIEPVEVRVQGGDMTRLRERALAEAQRQAVERALTPDARRRLRAEDVARLIAFIDVIQEQATAEGYRGVYRVGVDTGRMTLAPTNEAGPPAGAPSWVLVLPARAMPRGLEVWNLDDPWMLAWRQGVMQSDIPVMPATGDAEDVDLVSQRQAEARDTAALRRLAQKYQAPAVALVAIDEVGVLPGSVDPEEARAEVLYLGPDGGVSRVLVSAPRRDGGVRDIANDVAVVVRRLARDAAAPPAFSTPTPTPGLAPAPTYPTASYPGAQDPTRPSYSSGPQGPTAMFLRIPVRNADEWWSLKERIEAIPGAGFRATTAPGAPTLEGYVGYQGSAEALRLELSRRGLPAS